MAAAHDVVIYVLLVIGRSSSSFLIPCGLECDYNPTRTRYSCSGRSLACIPTPCCVDGTRVLDLSVNNITTIGPMAFRSFPNLNTLDVKLNAIHSLATGAFQGLRYLHNLDLRDNRLETLGAGSFGGMLNLRALVLSKNRISGIGPGTFRLLPNLKTLKFRHNLLQVVHPDGFAPATGLVTLDLDSNEIHTVHRGSFATLVNLETLSLADNNIASLPEFLDPLTELEELRLEGNPLHCDCSLEFLRRWFRGEQGERGEQEGDDSAEIGNSGECSQPLRLKGRLLGAINTRLLCDVYNQPIGEKNEPDATSRPAGPTSELTEMEDTGTEEPGSDDGDAITSLLTNYATPSSANENSSSSSSSITHNNNNDAIEVRTASPSLADVTETDANRLGAADADATNDVANVGKFRSSEDTSSNKGQRVTTAVGVANFPNYADDGRISLHGQPGTRGPSPNVSDMPVTPSTGLEGDYYDFNNTERGQNDPSFQLTEAARSNSSRRVDPGNVPLRGGLVGVHDTPSVVADLPLGSGTVPVKASHVYDTAAVVNATTDFDSDATRQTDSANTSGQAEVVQWSAMVGESVRLECPMSPLLNSLSYHETKWLSPSGQRVDDSALRFSISRDHGALSISEVGPSDSGTYRCVRRTRYPGDHRPPPSMTAVELRVSCPCRQTPELNSSTRNIGTSRAMSTTTSSPPPTDGIANMAEGQGSPAVETFPCNRVPVAVSILITFQATVALCTLTFCALLGWRSSSETVGRSRSDSFLERPRTVSEVNYYDSGEAPPSRSSSSSEVPTIVYESTGDDDDVVVVEGTANDENASESDSALLSSSGSHRNGAIDAEYVNAPGQSDPGETYADLDPNSRVRNDTYSSLHLQDPEEG